MRFFPPTPIVTKLAGKIITVELPDSAVPATQSQTTANNTHTLTTIPLTASASSPDHVSNDDESCRAASAGANALHTSTTPPRPLSPTPPWRSLSPTPPRSLSPTPPRPLSPIPSRPYLSSCSPSLFSEPPDDHVSVTGM